MLKFYITILSVILLTALASVGFVSASSTDGTIDSSNKYAWSENAGWLNFGVSQGNVHITDSALTGYAYGENIGWIFLNCSNNNGCGAADFKVANNGEGTLSGYAWSENTGWVNFKPTGGGVIINSSGEFIGQAYGENIGWLTFNCSTTSSCATVDYKVKTDWRPQSARVCVSWTYSDWSSCSNGQQTRTVVLSSPSGCSGGSPTLSQSCSSGGAIVPFLLNSGASAGQTGLTAPVEKIQEIVSELPQKLAELKNNTAELIKPLVETVVKSPLPPNNRGGVNVKSPLPPFNKGGINVEEIKKAVPAETPEVLKGEWPLFPEGPVKNFALTPLTKELSLLLNKFPDLEKTFINLGVNKIDDLGKLEGVKLILPGLTAALGLTGGATADGGIILNGGIPLNQLSPEAKEKIPAEIVFAKSAGQSVDFNMELTVSKTGQTQSQIRVISGRSLSLLVRPENQAKSVKGSIIFKDKTAELNSKKILAGVLKNLAVKPVLAEVETRMVLDEFNYNDDNQDGIWTADIKIPVVTGNYEIITKIDYQDDKLKVKEIRLITVVDPEGYIFKKSGQNETRLSGAVISLFWQNQQNNNFELWPAEKYQQANPQTTDITGRYSFLTPPGQYYLKVELAGYPPYQGERFMVKEGNNVNFNIELKPKFWNFKTLDWKTIFLIIFGLLLSYNFYRDRKRNKV